MATQVITADGVNHDLTKFKLVGSVKRVRDREIHDEPKSGEFPVFVEQFGSYRMFTYSSKIAVLK